MDILNMVIVSNTSITPEERIVEAFGGKEIDIISIEYIPDDDKVYFKYLYDANHNTASFTIILPFYRPRNCPAALQKCRW